MNVPVRRGDALVLGYAVLAQVELHAWYPQAGPLPRLALLGSVLVLLARHRWPVVAPLLAAAGGTGVGVWDTANGTGSGIVLAVAAGGLLGRQGRHGVPGLVALVLLGVAGNALDFAQASDLVAAPVLVLAVAAATAGLYRTSRQADDVRRHIEALHVRRASGHDDAVGAERRRLARELHDVVSHHLTVAALQASGARMHLSVHGRTSAVDDALAAAEEAGRRALAELRQLIGVVGTDSALAPQPGLADLPGMVTQLSGTGVPVHVTGAESVPPLPPGLDVAVFRLLQESLTNAARHGRGAVEVRLEAAGGRLVLDVVNDVAAPGRPGGHGLIGMRERAAVYGGTVEAGRRDGRWHVRVVLPLGADRLVPA